MAEFEASVVEAVLRHMNEDHLDDSLLIVQALGGEPEAVGARMTGFDGDGADFVAVVDGEERPVRVPWSRSITERAEVRAEVVALYERACQAAGITPRPH